MNDTGINNLASSHSVAASVERLETLLRANGLKIFLRLDQAAEAKAVGLTMPPMVLIIFGDPKTGTPLMQRHPSLAMDLPLKALVWESGDGKVWISHHRPEFLQVRHGLDTLPFQNVGRLLQTAAQRAQTAIEFDR